MAEHHPFRLPFDDRARDTLSSYAASYDMTAEPRPPSAVHHQNSNAVGVPNPHASPSSQLKGRSTALELPDEAPYPYATQHLPSSVTSASEAEEQRSERYSSENDPLRLSLHLKSDEELRALVRPEMSIKRTAHGKKIRGFYREQNQNIKRLLRPVDEHRRQAKETGESNHLRYKIATYGSFIASLVLAALQIYGAVSSGSLSLFTTMADAVFDPMSNVTLLICDKAVKRVDPRKYPAGKARIETAGNIFFCFLMTSVSFILIAFSIQELARGSDSETGSFHLPSVIAVCVAFGTKFVLFLYCWSLRNTFSQIRMLWEDHRNDLFINGFGVLTSVGGSKLRWWLDPAGALVLSLLISALWLKTAYSMFNLLIGVTADTHVQQLITYICKDAPPF